MKKYLLTLTFLVSLLTSGFTQSQEKMLYSLGSSGAAVVFTTYQYLDLIYEGLIEQCHTVEQVANATRAQMGLLEVFQMSYQDLLDNGELTDPSDQMNIKRMVEIVNLLKEQATHLNSFSVDGDPKSQESFLTTKEEAWVRISDLLGFGTDS